MDWVGGISVEISEFELSEYSVTVLTTAQRNLLAVTILCLQTLTEKLVLTLVFNLEINTQ
jgi:hypothetical protein